MSKRSRGNSAYPIVMAAIEGLAIGDTATIPVPDNLPNFRKYLSEISKRRGEKYTTKITGDSMEIMRVKYFNIYSKEVE